MRPFDTIMEHDQCLLDRHNELVKPQDKVYHLGDVTMARQPNARLLDKIKAFHGHKRLVRGNHDQWPTRKYLDVFEEVYAYRVLAEVIMSHIPVHPASVNRRLYGNVHGHVHANGSPAGPYMNICPEVTRYAPVHLDVVREELRKKRVDNAFAGIV
jgi:calcineurin-like phosphoesterase family protein